MTIRQFIDCPRPGGLTKLSHIRTELAKVYRDARTGRIDSRQGTRLAFILAQLGKLIAYENLESRIEALEQQNAQPTQTTYSGFIGDYEDEPHIRQTN